MHAREKVVAKLEKQLPTQSKARHVKIAFSREDAAACRRRSSAQDLCKSFGDKRVLNRVSVEVGATARLGIIGENGAGKTTLLRLLTGDLAAGHRKHPSQPEARVGLVSPGAGGPERRPHRLAGGRVARLRHAASRCAAPSPTSSSATSASTSESAPSAAANGRDWRSAS